MHIRIEIRASEAKGRGFDPRQPHQINDLREPRAAATVK